MRRSEQVIYITLIDFLMQLLFLGLVLWVIFGLSKPGIPQKEIDAIGGPGKATEVLQRVKDLLGKYPGNDLNGLLHDFSVIVDSSGGINQAMEFAKGIKDLMDKTKINDPNELVNKLRTMIDETGGLTQVSELPALIKDLMDKVGMKNQDPKEFLKTVEAIADAANGLKGLDHVAAFLTQVKDLMASAGIKEPQALFAKLKAIDDAGGIGEVQKILAKIHGMGNGADKMDIDKLLDELVKLKQLQPDIDVLGGIAKNIELAKEAKLIIDKTGIDDPDKLAELINKAQRIINASGKSDAPPHIILSETQGFPFDSGSAKLSWAFRGKLENDVVDHIQQAIDKYGINLIEVIGHTDGQPVKRGSKQMDTALESMAGQIYVADRMPNAVQGSNTDLGMLRALEVVKLLKHLRSQGKLQQIDPDTGFRAYSSGQLTMPDGRLSNGQNRKDEPDRRRIEIRLTRLGDRIQEK